MAGRPLRDSSGKYRGSPYRALARRITPAHTQPRARASKIRASAHNVVRAVSAASRGGVQSQKL